jgi:hypothetical protein
VSPQPELTFAWDSFSSSEEEVHPDAVPNATTKSGKHAATSDRMKL